MNKFKFTKYPDPDNREFDKSTVEVTFEATTIDDVLAELEYFLSGCGFQVQKGSIEYIKDEDI